MSERVNPREAGLESAASDRERQERRERWTRRAVIAWLLVVLWSATIWSLGGDDFSAASTSRFLSPLLDFLLPHLDVHTIGRVHFLLRKWAHVFEYGLLAWLTYRALRLARRGDPSWLRPTLFALCFVAVLATADEYRQSLSPLRTGSARDVVIDTAGGGMALLLSAAIARIFSLRPWRTRSAT